MISYLKYDQGMPSPYSKFIWVPLIDHASAFESSDIADSYRHRVPDATGITEQNGNWYIVKEHDAP